MMDSEKDNRRFVQSGKRENGTKIKVVGYYYFIILPRDFKDAFI